MSEGENKAQSQPASGAAPGGENTVGKVIPQTSPAPAGGKSQPDKAWYAQVWDGFMKSMAKDHLEAVGFGIEAGSLDPQGNAEKVGALAFDQLKEYVDSIKERIPGMKAGARANQSQKKPGKAEPAKKEQEKKQEEASTKGKDANCSGGGNCKKKAVMKCGEDGSYGELKKKTGGGKFDRDHIPSKAALLEKAKELNNGTELSKDQINKIVNWGNSIAIPRKAHQDISPTYGGRNTPAADAKDLAGSAKRDVDTMLEKIDEYDADGSCKKAYKKASKKILKMTNDDYKRELKKLLD